MNTKKASGLFLTIILVHLAAAAGLRFYVPPFMRNMTGNILVSEMIIWVPAVIFLAVTRTNVFKLCRMRKVHLSSLLMTVLLAFLCMPLITLANALSMLFVDNTVAQMSPYIVSQPLAVMLLMMAVYGPFAEEFVFRGILYQSYKKQGNVFLAVLISAVLFALMHMNFNQAAYAFVVGIVLAVLMEAADSFWPVFLVHFLINAGSTVTLHLTQRFAGDLMEEAMDLAGSMPRQELMMAICVYLVLAVICTPLAGCVLAWIARREGRLEHVRYIWRSRKNSKKGLLSLTLASASVICLVYMIWQVIISLD